MTEGLLKDKLSITKEVSEINNISLITTISLMKLFRKVIQEFQIAH